MRLINFKVSNPMNRLVYNEYRLDLDDKKLVIETYHSVDGKAVLCGTAEIPVSNKQDAITFLNHSLWQGKQVRNAIETIPEFGVPGQGSGSKKQRKAAEVEVVGEKVEGQPEVIEA